MNKPSCLIRWLGVAGLEFNFNGFTLLIDPYLSRISLWRFLFGKIKHNEHNEQKIFSKITAANAVLITHSHFDHLMDVPAIAKQFNCPIYGSPNTCLLLERCNVSSVQIREVAPRDEFLTGPFHVKVKKSSHPFVPFFKSITLPNTSKPPRRALDFGMDSQYAYRISTSSNTFLTDPGSEAHRDTIDILFISALQSSRVIRQVLTTINPTVVIPIHWDNYFKAFALSCQAPSWGLLPVNRVFLKTLEKMVYALTPRGRFFFPEPFKYYSLEDILYQKDAYTRYPAIYNV